MGIDDFKLYLILMLYLHNSYFCDLFLCPLQDSDEEELNLKYLIFKTLLFPIFQFTRWTILRTTEIFWYSSHKNGMHTRKCSMDTLFGHHFLCCAKRFKIMFWLG